MAYAKHDVTWYFHVHLAASEATFPAEMSALIVDVVMKMQVTLVIAALGCFPLPIYLSVFTDCM